MSDVTDEFRALADELPDRHASLSLANRVRLNERDSSSRERTYRVNPER